MKFTGDPSLPSGPAELQAMLSKRLAGPLPESYEERLSLLGDHLRDVTAYLGSLTPNPFVAGPDQIAQSISLASQLSAEIRRAQQASALERMSDCDAAAAWGVGLITVGALGGGPVGAVAGFVYGVGLLATSC